mmetsp:Transcript_2595/g.8079  ORF Transcript_2595/g.8079 Transcript_2595/m.8079 type:complete len:1106 (-) Transcript_2595:252-3569(-)
MSMRAVVALIGCAAASGGIPFRDAKFRALEAREERARVGGASRREMVTGLFQSGARKRASSAGRRLDANCDSAFDACEADVGCSACVTDVLMYPQNAYLELSEASGACTAVVEFLHSYGLCQGIQASDDSGSKMCTMWENCAERIVDDDDRLTTYYGYYYGYGDDDDEPGETARCDPNICQVAHPVWLGDGFCDDASACYNTAACDYDGGDCCEATCRDTLTRKCGSDGSPFVCRDPLHQSCLDRSQGAYVLEKASAQGASLTIYDAAVGTVDSARVAPAAFSTQANVTGDVCLPDGCFVVEVDADDHFSSSSAFRVSRNTDSSSSVHGVAPAVCLLASGATGASQGYCDNWLADFGLTEPGCSASAPSETCPETSTFLMVMKDESYSGWDSDIEYVVAERDSGDVVRRGSLAAGHAGVDAMCIKTPGCYTVTLENGFFSSDTSWTLGRRNVGPVAVGGAPATCRFAVGDGVADCQSTCPPDHGDSECADNELAYAFEMYSDSADGWRTDATVQDDQGAVSGTFRASSRRSQDRVCLASDTCYTFRFDSTSDPTAAWALGRASGDDDSTLVLSDTAANMAGDQCFFSVSADACSGRTPDNICATAGKLSPPPPPSPRAYCENGYQLVTAWLYDTWGDGWNGAVLTLSSLSDPTKDKDLEPATLTQGSLGNQSWCLPVASCYAVDVTSGEWHDEVSWALTTPQADPTKPDIMITYGAAPETCGFGLPVMDSYLSPSLDEIPLCDTQCLQRAEWDDDSLPSDQGWYYASFYADDQADLCGPATKECDLDQVRDGLAAVNDVGTCLEDTDSYTLANSDPFDTDLWRNRPGLCEENYDWDGLDDFIECSEDVSTEEEAEACMQMLAALVPDNSDDSVAADELVERLATVVYYSGDTFCECVDADVPSCGDFSGFKTILREAQEACNALDNVDCLYLGRYADECIAALSKDGQIPWTDETCRTIDTYGCKNDNDGVMTIPSVRRWDCLDLHSHEMTTAQKTFILNVEKYCEKGEEPPAPSGKTKKSGDKGEKANTGRTVLIVFLTFLVVVLAGIIAIWAYKRRNATETFFVPVSRQALDENGNELVYSPPLAENPLTQGAENPLAQGAGA